MHLSGHPFGQDSQDRDGEDSHDATCPEEMPAKERRRRRCNAHAEHTATAAVPPPIFSA